MAVTQNVFNGNGIQTNFPFTFPYLKTSDVKASVDGVATTAFTLANATTVQFNTAPPANAAILIFRETGIDDLTATFFAGSAIKSEDLNDNFTQNLFVTQEVNNRFLSILGGNAMEQDLILGKSVDIVMEGETDNDNELTIKAGDPTDDRIITFPDVTGTVVTTGDTGTVTSTMITDGTIVDGDIADTTITGGKLVNDTITAAQIANNAVTVNELADNAVDRAAIVGDAVDGTKIADDSVDSEHIVADSLDTEHYAPGSVDNTALGSDAVNGDKIADDSINSEHYVDGSIDTAHIANGAVTDTQIATGTLDNRYYTESELDSGQLDNRYYTETELLTDGVLDARYYTETEAEAKFLRQDSSETIASGVAWSNSDAFVATTAAINARIIDLIDDVGGFTAIANETSFPDTNPQGTSGQAAILSVATIGTARTPSGTTVTIANGNASSNATITITGVPSTLPAGFGVLVESTSTLHTYTFHRLVPKATEVTTVAANATAIAAAGNNVTDINNFADLYQISANAPSQRADGTSLSEGDLWYDSSNDNIRVYDGSSFAAVTPTQQVLNDIAIVSGAITFQEDLGLITDAVTTGSSNGSLDIVADAIEDEVTLAITVEDHSGNKYVIDGDSSNPAKALTLYKGWTYTFDQSHSSNLNHRIAFKTDSGNYTTNVETSSAGAGNAGSYVKITIPESQPTGFRYYCTVHGNAMGNTITVKDDPLKTVADNISSVAAVANNNSNINAVHSNASNINSAVSNASNINSAVSNASNINSVVSNASNINTVAGDISNVNSVASNISNVNSVHSNASNINSAVSNASNINTVVGSISNVNTVATNISNVNDFSDKYRVASSAPTSNNDAGDLYFDTSSNELRVYNGSAWQGGVTATGNLAGLGANTFSGDQTVNANIIVTGTVDGVDIAAFKTSFDNLNTDVVNDTTPQLGGALDGQNNNLNNIGTIDGTNLQLDFGTI